MLQPFPTHIMQKDQQYVVFNGNLYFFSPYTVKKQSLHVKLSAGALEYYSKQVQPVRRNGTTLVYGSYENVGPYSKSPLRVHYENNSPFLVVKNIERVIEVSHWGNIAVEEKLQIVHEGAQLIGPFSRLDFQRDFREKMPCVRQLKTVLPASAAHVYYRDEIGNVSTSHMRVLDDAVELIFEPRFPLFGGWKTDYVIGYNVPTYEYLYSSGSRFGLKMRFVDHIFDSFVADSVTVKIILPEGSSDFNFKCPYDVVKGPLEYHFTYLDSSGRPVITAHKSNVVENHIQSFELFYSWDRTLIYREPAMVVIACFLLFFVVIVWVRLDFTIVEDRVAESRVKLSAIMDNITSLHNQRSADYESYIDLVNKLKVDKDLAHFNSAKKKIENDFKLQNQQISDLHAQLKAESAEAAEKVNEMQRLDRSIKEVISNWATAVERFVVGKGSKQLMTDLEKNLRLKMDETAEKIGHLLYSI
ncbi:unnamed protein product [Soboliphyme baturini]|uniref:Dolichyl-diphosphooligosaccharide--protein glycosyltransferase subunit 1 n=1 Tax=Soboliphyme baturini TaxID=241478 RepID=A0A183J403_9BILA|nr:unnamed protein product [Soboliphyme baturini]